MLLIVMQAWYLNGVLSIGLIEKWAMPVGMSGSKDTDGGNPEEIGKMQKSGIRSDEEPRLLDEMSCGK